MNTSFLPVGMGLPTGVFTVMSVGRLVASARTALACVSVALVSLWDADDPELLEPELLSLEPQPAATTMSAIATATTPARRRYLLHADVSGDMCIPPGDSVCSGSVDPGSTCWGATGPTYAWRRRFGWRAAGCL